MDQLGSKFCVKTSDDDLFSFVLGVLFKGLGKVKGVSRFFWRSLDIFALNQALGPAGVLLTRGEDGNAILIRRVQLWTSREWEHGRRGSVVNVVLHSCEFHSWRL